MDELAHNLASPTWWVGVVIVGLLINLASAYLKPGLDYLMSSVRMHRRTKAQERYAAYEIEVSELSRDVELQRQYEHHHISTMLNSLVFLAFAALFVVVKVIAIIFPELSIARDLGVPPAQSAAVFYAVLSLIFVAAFRSLLLATAVEDKLFVARRRAKERNNTKL